MGKLGKSVEAELADEGGKEARKSPEERANCCSKMFFLFVLPFFRRATKLKSDLTLEHLDPQPRVEDPNAYLERLKAVFYLKEDGTPSMSFRRAVIHLIWRNLVVSVIVMNLAVLIGLVSPYLISVIVVVCTPDQNGDYAYPIWVGLLAALGIFTASVLSITISQNAWHIGTRCARGAYAAVSAILFEKPSLMTNSEMSGFSEGEIVNLMALDTQTVFQVVMFFNLFAILPALVFGPAILLITQLGWPVVVSIVVLFFNTFLVDYLSKVITRWQKYKNELSDKRGIRMNESLQGIRTVKLNAWEGFVRRRIMQYRSEEVRELRKMSVLRAFQYFLSFCIPTLVMVATFILYEAAVEGAVLDNAKIFFCIPLFVQVAMGLFLIPNMVNEYRRYRVSADRLERFLMLRNDYKDREILSHNGEVDIKDAALTWTSSTNTKAASEKTDVNGSKPEDNHSPTEEKMTLRNLSLHVKSGQIVAVVGKVASGKTTLLSGVLNLLRVPSGTIQVNGTTAYVAQSAFVMNETIRDNICFGEPYDKEKYKRVIKACALDKDIATFRSGDMTEVGEKGITLSGGQKQRLALCRASYVDREIIVFDDCLSAMDAHVGETRFNDCFLGLLKNKTRIFATNQLNFAKRCDVIVVLKDETILDCGPYHELVGRNPDLFSSLTSSTSDTTEEEPPQIEEILPAQDDSGEATEDPMDEHEGKEKDKVMTEESKVKGRVGVRDFFTLGKEAGTTWLLLCMGVLLFTVPTLQFLVSYYISEWAEAINSGTTNTSAMNAPSSNLANAELTTLLIITVVFSVSAAGLSFTMNWFFLLSAKRLHDGMLDTILQNPMSWFDTTPVGRILQRFSGDILHLDLVIPRLLEMWADNLGQVLIGIVPSAIILPPFIALVIPVLIFLYMAYRFYGLIILETQRLAMVAIGPILSSFQAYLQGLPSIRAFGKIGYFIDKFHKNNAAYTQSMYCQFCIDRLFLVMIGGPLVSSFIFVLAAVLVGLRDTAWITPQLAGLLLTYSITLNFRFFGLFYSTAQIERFMASSQRCVEYLHMDAEPQVSLESKESEAEIERWPATTGIEFKDVKMRYRDDLPEVLHGVNFKVEAGEKAALVGRSGCGKSSIVLTVFRMIELSHGSIYIGGMDIRSVPLQILRSKIGMIPQDPWLFQGTIRENLDVLKEHADDEIWTALKLVNLHDTVKGLEGQLDHEVEEKGDNLSGGTVQLLCLARVLLKKPKVILMDEATSSVDQETDNIVQRTIRSQFNQSTLLTIAHRLQTIIDFDKIIVVDDGVVTECAPPWELLRDLPNGAFSSLVEATGRESAAELKRRAMAAEKKAKELRNS